MELGRNIVKIRKSNKLTQDDLANKYYVTRQTISNWENGKSYPDLETLVKISNDFNISLDVLLKEDDKMIKDITDKQKKYESSKIVILLINIMAIICLIYFGFIYLIHDETIPNPNGTQIGLKSHIHSNVITPTILRTIIPIIPKIKIISTNRSLKSSELIL